MEKRGIFQNIQGTLRGGPQCGWGWGWKAALRTNKKKRMSNRGGSDEREMKVTSSKPRKIRVAEEDNEGRQEKGTSVWRCLDPGAPAAAPWRCQRGAAACPKHPQRETFAAAMKRCTANPPGWLRSGFGDRPLLYHSHVDCKQQPSRELSLENV